MRIGLALNKQCSSNSQNRVNLSAGAHLHILFDGKTATNVSGVPLVSKLEDASLNLGVKLDYQWGDNILTASLTTTQGGEIQDYRASLSARSVLLLAYVSVEKSPDIHTEETECRGSLRAGLHKDWFTDDRWHRTPDFNGNQGLFCNNPACLRIANGKWTVFSRSNRFGDGRKIANRFGFLPETAGERAGRYANQVWKITEHTGIFGKSSGEIHPKTADVFAGKFTPVWLQKQVAKIYFDTLTEV